MLEQIVFTLTAFIFFIYILCFKLIKKNDTTYLTILALQAIGIFINFMSINSNMLNSTSWQVAKLIFCIILPIVVFILERKKINISESLNLFMVHMYVWIEKPKKAKKILTNLVNKYPNSYRGHKCLAHIYENEGGMRKAIDEYVQVLNIKKNDYDSYYKISKLLNDLGKQDEAAEMLITLIKNRPMDEASNMLAQIYLDKKEFKQAIEIYTNSLKNNPNNFEIYYKLGICYSMINDFDVARKCFQKTLEINNSIYLAYYRLGQIALLYRDFDVAEENFSKSTCNEKEARSYFELAKIHAMKNQKEKAILDATKAIKVDSEYYEIIKNEPVLFPIKQAIEKPKNTTKPEYKETEQEKEIDEYLRDTYNLTRLLNGKDNIPKHKRA